MSKDQSKKTVVVCDTQPITAEGMRTLLAAEEDLEFLASLNSLEAATQLVSAQPPDVMIVDKGFGMRAVLDWIQDLKMAESAPILMVWGVSMTEAEALRLLAHDRVPTSILSRGVAGAIGSTDAGRLLRSPG